MTDIESQDLESQALLTFLDAQRASALAIVDGLDEDALRASVVPSGWTPLGLIEHLGFAERYWFQQVATGSATELPWPYGEIADEVSDLRWIVLHMIEETARHAGHLDIARELIDGQTGLGPR